MTQTLMAAFDFTAEELAANQAGTITESQLPKLNARYHATEYLSLSLLLLLPGVGGAICCLLAFSARFPTVDLVLALLQGIVLLGAWLYFFGQSIRYGWLLRRDRAQRRITPFSGKVTLHTQKGYRGGSSYYMVLEGKTFKLDWQRFQTLRQGYLYTFYCATHTEFILSAEDPNAPRNSINAGKLAR